MQYNRECGQSYKRPRRWKVEASNGAESESASLRGGPRLRNRSLAGRGPSSGYLDEVAMSQQDGPCSKRFARGGCDNGGCIYNGYCMYSVLLADHIGVYVFPAPKLTRSVPATKQNTQGILAPGHGLARLNLSALRQLKRQTNTSSGAVRKSNVAERDNSSRRY